MSTKVSSKASEWPIPCTSTPRPFLLQRARAAYCRRRVSRPLEHVCELHQGPQVGVLRAQVRYDGLHNGGRVRRRASEKPPTNKGARGVLAGTQLPRYRSPVETSIARDRDSTNTAMLATQCGLGRHAFSLMKRTIDFRNGSSGTVCTV